MRIIGGFCVFFLFEIIVFGDLFEIFDLIIGLFIWWLLKLEKNNNMELNIYLLFIN